VTRTYILVPGAWHGPWCWHKLTPLLEAAGMAVVTPELPAAGATLESWSRGIAAQATRVPGCVLVGHSRAGALISRAAELVPAAIGRLVYLSAYLLPAGDSVAAEARRDGGSLIAPNMIPAEAGISCLLREETWRDAFYGECSEEDYAYARQRLAPEPLRPLATPLRITPEKCGRVPRDYIETTRDRAVTLDAQRRMQAASPCSRVFTLDTDHSAFLSQPEALARILISI
jgi:pimeloyl-ACP methyl ester carboxylesterase